MIIPSIVKESGDLSKGITHRRFYIPSIGQVLSDEIQLLLPPVGIITFMKIECDSIDYDIHLLNRAGVNINEEGDIFSYYAINKIYGILGSDLIRLTPNELNIPYRNQDIPTSPYLYCRIENNSATPTGLITINTTIQEA